MKKFLLVLSCLVLVCVAVVFLVPGFRDRVIGPRGEASAPPGSSPPYNVAFEKNVSAELRQKYPVCDEFLEVKWIDPGRGMGRMKYTEYINGEKTRDAQQAIVAVSPWPEDSYFTGNSFSAYHFPNTVDLHDLDSFLRGAHLNTYAPLFELTVEKGRRTEDYPQVLKFSCRVPNEPPSDFDSLAVLEKNVCLIHPRGDVALIVEARTPFAYESRDSARRKQYDAVMRIMRRECAKLAPKGEEHRCSMANIPFGFSIDVDGDGKKDFVSSFNVPTFESNGGMFLGVRNFLLLSGSSTPFYISGTDSSLFDRPLSYNAGERSLYFGTRNLTKMIREVK